MGSFIRKEGVQGITDLMTALRNVMSVNLNH